MHALARHEPRAKAGWQTPVNRASAANFPDDQCDDLIPTLTARATLLQPWDASSFDSSGGGCERRRAQ